MSIYTCDDFPENINTLDYHLNCSKKMLEDTLGCRRWNDSGDIVA